jgi:hypothetical protein
VRCLTGVSCEVHGPASGTDCERRPVGGVFRPVEYTASSRASERSVEFSRLYNIYHYTTFYHVPPTASRRPPPDRKVFQLW